MAIYRVREPFAFDQTDGVQRVMRPGDLVSGNDAAYKGKEHLFEPVEAAAARAVETTSAAPGERRLRTGPRRGRKPAKATGDQQSEANASDSKPDAKPEDKTEGKTDAEAATGKQGE